MSCSRGYKNEGIAVYYEHWNEGSGQHKERIDVDPWTFKILKFKDYAKDDSSVFYQGEKIIGADAKTFEALDDFYARDKRFGWYGKDTIRNSNGLTFKVINDYYSTDGHDVFYTTYPLAMVDPKNFKFVYGEGDYECWTTDGKYYYYKNYKVPSDDYENLKIYPKSGGISSDRHWAFYQDHKLNYDIDGKHVVDTIDIKSFKVTGFIECRDKYGCFNVYHGRDKCAD
ncbi:DKNYY domain-containing protein [Chitinophagaceae bacterium 26-R-25]|nr:DKNYY domain-containing protein [Chitinophagaceae bacterium 26-R-25]